MNIAKYSTFRLFIWFLFVGGFLWRGGFVAMQDQVIEFYQQETQSFYETLQDNSLQKYLWNGQSLIDPNYVPSDLAPIDSDFTANNARKFLMREVAAKNFADLAWYFWKVHNWDKLVITSTYRSAKFQESLLKKWCSRAKCAEVWSSEHQLGLAIDLGVLTKKWKYIALAKWNTYYQWLMKNAADWWFHNTYQKWIDIDGQMEEAWHWRYVWSDLAKDLRDNNQSFGEWYAFQQTTNTHF